ncbi:WD40-repeat-containing domain [Pseudocohnilembus persalinus]|uniref:WD40-repeat-containing domain n=1 Tax=Pseudocohnilembus persalinus TaxID=266149 RepID=A0A0V0QQ18_PSEPJ|nr:WD40-repeat-containing domain [Pseudocohnilembus persalinus]|eukprot:KRX04415.1 WD40-repeat-containing domain [Pseudocohnilembus persalinus]
MSQMSSQKKDQNPWLNAFRDPVANLQVCDKGIKLVDILGDGDTRVVIADQQNKIVQYKGINIEWEQQINDRPIALEYFMEQQGANIPSLAFACDKHIYIYRLMRPVFRVNIPGAGMDQREHKIWEDFNLEPGQFQGFIEKLAEIKKSQTFQLSYHSLFALSQNSTKKAFSYVKQLKQSNSLLTPDTCVCLGQIKIDKPGKQYPSQLLIGTELKQLYYMNEKGYDLGIPLQLSGVPVLIESCGILSGNHQIVVGLRENQIVIIENKSIKRIIPLVSKLVSFVISDSIIYSGMMDDSLQSFNFQGYIVALQNQEIKIFKERNLIYSFNGDAVVTAMKFGPFGREDGTLILVYKNKGLDIKMLIRQFNVQNYINQALQNEQNQEEKPLALPKKTKLFIENSLREIDDPVSMHKVFQKDLMKMRLKTAQTYLNLLNDGNFQNMLANEANLRLQADVRGLGPLFRIELKVVNLSNEPMTGLQIMYTYDQSIFKIKKSVNMISFLMPNISYPIEISVENIDENGTGDTIKILVCKQGQSTPLIGALVPMPMSELRE